MRRLDRSDTIIYHNARGSLNFTGRFLCTVLTLVVKRSFDWESCIVKVGSDFGKRYTPHFSAVMAEMFGKDLSHNMPAR